MVQVRRQADPPGPARPMATFASVVMGLWWHARMMANMAGDLMLYPAAGALGLFLKRGFLSLDQQHSMVVVGVFVED